MNLSELTDQVSQAIGAPKAQTREVIKTTFDAMQLEVSKGGRVCIVGFGSFYPFSRKQRMGRNPQTGEEVTIPAALVPRFKPGKDFKDSIQKASSKAAPKKSRPKVTKKTKRS
jgi:DNA-binding protein HU-beta